MLNKIKTNLFFKAFTIHALASIIYMAAFTLTFNYSLWIVVRHIEVLLLINISFLYLLNIFFYNKSLRRKTIFLIFSLSFILIYTILLILIYSLNWLMNKEWGSNIVWNFIYALPNQINAIMIISNTSYLYLFGVLSIVFISALLFSYYLSIKIWRKYEFNKIFNKYSFLLFIFIVVDMTFSINNKSFNWQGEPITHLFAKNRYYSDNIINQVEVTKAKRERLRLLPKYEKSKVKKNVILIISDALRADHMSLYGYSRDTTPYLDELNRQKQVIKVDFVSSSCSESVCGIISTLSSKIYKFIGTNLYKLPDVLKDIGYESTFILGGDHNLNFLKSLYGKSFDKYYDGRSFAKNITIHDDNGIIEILKTLPNDTKKPSFVYLHMMSAHILSPDIEEFNRYTPAISFVERLKQKKHSEQRRLMEVNAYDNGILQLDSFLKQVIKILDEKKYLNDAIIVLTSDHGDGLGERKNYSHTYHLYNEDIKIPLVFISKNKLPDIKNIEYATQIDIAPTIIDFLGLQIPNVWDGISLLRPALDERITFHQTIREKPEVAIILKNSDVFYKMIATKEVNELDNFKLFDLNSDPMEVNNIIARASKKLVKRLKELLLNEFNSSTVLENT